MVTKGHAHVNKSVAFSGRFVLSLYDLLPPRSMKGLKDNAYKNAFSSLF